LSLISLNRVTNLYDVMDAAYCSIELHEHSRSLNHVPLIDHNNEIKRAYRKLMSQYHPDKLTGQGLPDDMIAMATEKTKEIQLAYDLIQKRRAG
jgi:hypothetical protein